MLRTGKTLAIVMAVTCISGCGEDEPQERKSATGDSTTQAIGTGNEGPETTAVVQSGQDTSVHTLSLRLGNTIAEYTYTGTLLDSARWTDANGENMLLVSHRTMDAEGAEFEGSYMEELSGYHYVTRGGTTSLLWKICDSAYNHCDPGRGLLSKIVVRDLNNDGVAENAFVYNIDGLCDVSPAPVTLVLHSGINEYIIYSTMEPQAGNTDSVTYPLKGVEHRDAAFDTAPPEFRAFAEDLWQKSLKNLWKEQAQ